MNTIKRNFTLIEILVAVAVLVIMMGFQFTGGAQRVWSANTARTEMSAQADAIFSLIREDLEHIYIVEEDEDMDAQSGWYCRHSDGTSINDTPFAASDKSLKDLCFFTQATDGIENYTPGSGRSLIYGVRYHFAPATGDLGEEERQAQEDQRPLVVDGLREYGCLPDAGNGGAQVPAAVEHIRIPEARL